MLLSFHCVSACERVRERKGETRLPQQLCHYVGGNYESEENGEGERIGAKASTLGENENYHLEQICPVDSEICVLSQDEQGQTFTKRRG